MDVQHSSLLDSENSGKDQSKPCLFPFGSQDMFGHQEPYSTSRVPPSPLPTAAFSLERVKVVGAKRERRGENSGKIRAW